MIRTCFRHTTREMDPDPASFVAPWDAPWIFRRAWNRSLHALAYPERPSGMYYGLLVWLVGLDWVDMVRWARQPPEAKQD